MEQVAPYLVQSLPFLSCGKPIKKSCELGIKYVSLGIKTNPKYGKGHGPINHLHTINIERKFR
jgi:hydroxymethylpyrimidine/phosphomethylpyrimidine kinase